MKAAKVRVRIHLVFMCSIAQFVSVANADITVSSVERLVHVEAYAGSSHPTNIDQSITTTGTCDWNFTRTATDGTANANASAIQQSNITVTSSQLTVSGSLSNNASAHSPSGGPGPIGFDVNTYLQVIFSVDKPTPYISTCSFSGQGAMHVFSDASDVALADGTQPLSGVLVAGVTYTLRIQSSGGGGAVSGGGYDGSSAGSATFQFQLSNETPMTVAMPGKYVGMVRNMTEVTPENVAAVSSMRVTGRATNDGRLILVDGAGTVHTMHLFPDGTAKVRRGGAEPILAGTATIHASKVTVQVATTEPRSDEIANLTEEHSFQYILRRVGR